MNRCRFAWHHVTLHRMSLHTGHDYKTNSVTVRGTLIQPDFSFTAVSKYG